MNGPERAAAATSAAAATARVNETVSQVSRTVRRRLRVGLRPLGRYGDLSMDVIDGNHDLVHGLVDSGARLAGQLAASHLHRTTPADATSVHDDDDKLATVAGLRAAFGDTLPEPLNPPIQLTCDRDTGNAALAVFMHGLGGHEQQWGESYLTTMADAGISCVQVRYSTGWPLAVNAQEFATAINHYLSDRERPTDRLVLVGHSMGGLVITEALATPAGQEWAGLVTEVVTLGTPFTGAPLERFARTTLAAGSRSELAAPILALGDHRSAGIKDLGDGITTPLPDHVRHVSVAACLGPSARSGKSRLLGDGMVSTASARGPEHPRRTVHVLANTGHNTLLDHPGVRDLLASQVAPAPAAP